MANPDIDRERELERELEDQRAANRDRQHYDNFRESIATPVPNRTYRSQADTLSDRSTIPERVIRYVAVILGALLAIRFIVNLFVTPAHAGYAAHLVYAATNWAVRPFQLLFGQPPTTMGGFFDWPALASLIAVGIIASILISLIRPRP